MRLSVAALLGAWLSTACSLPQFACEDDEQCTLSSAGVCQANGYCSYSDPACPSGQRYSEHAGDVSEQCVDAEVGSTGSTDTGTDATDPTLPTDSSPDPCLDVDCGPDGQCQSNGSDPSCACDEGFVELDLYCVEAGCPGTACIWVDAIDGDDASSGTSKRDPIRTLARAAELAPSLQPGEGLVLRGGQTWDEPLALVGLAGTEQQPIVVGAYEPTGAEPSPPLITGGISVEDSVGVRLQDLRATHSSGTALSLSGVSHTTVLRCEAYDARSGCITVGSGSEYTAVVESAVWSCNESGGQPVYGIALLQQGEGLGDHHWLLDNRIDGDGTTSALSIAATAADDVKAVRNYLRGSMERGFHSRVGTHAWVVGNVLAQTGDNNDAAFDHAGGGQIIGRGNIFVDTEWPAHLNGRGEWSFNTMLHAGPREAITIPGGTTNWTLRSNLVLASGVPSLLLASLDSLSADLNAYGPDCTFDAEGMMVDLAGWQALGQDADATCGPVPGPEIPAAIGSTRDWDDDGLLLSVVPDPAWSGCGDPAGAFACDGTPLAAGLPPFDDIGHGWEGPPEVQERVELVP